MTTLSTATAGATAPQGQTSHGKKRHARSPVGGIGASRPDTPAGGRRPWGRGPPRRHRRRRRRRRPYLGRRTRTRAQRRPRRGRTVSAGSVAVAATRRPRVGRPRGGGHARARTAPEPRAAHVPQPRRCGGRDCPPAGRGGHACTAAHLRRGWEGRVAGGPAAGPVAPVQPRRHAMHLGGAPHRRRGGGAGRPPRRGRRVRRRSPVGAPTPRARTPAAVARAGPSRPRAAACRRPPPPTAVVAAVCTAGGGSTGIRSTVRPGAETAGTHTPDARVGERLVGGGGGGGGGMARRPEHRRPAEAPVRRRVGHARGGVRGGGTPCRLCATSAPPPSADVMPGRHGELGRKGGALERRRQRVVRRRRTVAASGAARKRRVSGVGMARRASLAARPSRCADERPAADVHGGAGGGWDAVVPSVDWRADDPRTNWQGGRRGAGVGIKAPQHQTTTTVVDAGHWRSFEARPVQAAPQRPPRRQRAAGYAALRAHSRRNSREAADSSVGGGGSERVAATAARARDRRRASGPTGPGPPRRVGALCGRPAASRYQCQDLNTFLHVVVCARGGSRRDFVVPPTCRCAVGARSPPDELQLWPAGKACGVVSLAPPRWPGCMPSALVEERSARPPWSGHPTSKRAASLSRQSTGGLRGQRHQAGPRRPDQFYGAEPQRLHTVAVPAAAAAPDLVLRVAPFRPSDNRVGAASSAGASTQWVRGWC